MIRFELPERSEVRISIYGITGQLVRTLTDGERPAGYHQVIWDGRNGTGIKVSSGLYIYRMSAGSFSKVRKMILLK